MNDEPHSGRQAPLAPSPSWASAWPYERSEPYGSITGSSQAKDKLQKLNPTMPGLQSAFVMHGSPSSDVAQVPVVGPAPAHSPLQHV